MAVVATQVPHPPQSQHRRLKFKKSNKKTTNMPTENANPALAKDLGAPVERELASWGNTSSCTYNGTVLSVVPGMFGYNSSGVVLIDQETPIPLEQGSIYSLVGPNGAGKTSFVQALPELPGFPKNLAWEYLSSEQPPQVDADAAQQTAEEYCHSRIQKRIDELNSRISELEEEMETVESVEEEQIELLTNQLSDLYDVLDQLEVHASSSIGRMMDELEFGNYRHQKLQNLSMGWRYRCDLIAALVTQPTLLIVDEPSFLDAKSTDWLIQEFRDLTRSASKALVVLISHKEALLDDLTDRIISLNPATRKVSVYRCSYRDYLSAHAEQMAHAQRNLSQAQDQQQNAEASLANIKKQLKKREQSMKNKTTKDSDKRFIKGKNKEAKQKADHSAAAKMKRVQNKLQEVEAEQDGMWQQQSVVALPLEGMESTNSETSPLVSFHEASFHYEGSRDLILNEVDLQIGGHDKILLQGRNGEGKSTLVKLLLGQFEATGGEIRRRPFRYVYFPQNALPTLVREFGKLSAVDYIRHGRGENVTVTKARTYLGTFGFKGSLAVSAIRQLSAGQRVRLWLAGEYFDSFEDKKLAPSLLIMDEMTENLDVQTVDALVASLSKLNTAMLAISHDPNFVRVFPATEHWQLYDGRLRISHDD